MLMRRGHRLHSIAGAGSDLDMRRFATSLPETESRTLLEARLVEAVTAADVAAVRRFKESHALRLENYLKHTLLCAYLQAFMMHLASSARPTEGRRFPLIVVK